MVVNTCLNNIFDDKYYLVMDLALKSTEFNDNYMKFSLNVQLVFKVSNCATQSRRRLNSSLLGVGKITMWEMAMTTSYVTVYVRWLCTSAMVDGQCGCGQVP